MSARRVAEGKLDLPPNPTWIDFPESDGSASTWPTNTTRVIDHEGHVNFMQVQDLMSYSAVRWRITIAKAIAVEMRMPEGPSYVLRDWPDGYRMFDHNKGPVDNPRHDIYLFGSPKKFRSVNEFIPHAIWLYRDYKRTPAACQCKYCAKKTQKEVTSTLSIFRSTSISSSPIPSANKARVVREKNISLHSNRERQRDQKVYASVQKALKPVNQTLSLKPSSHVLKQPMVAERNADIRAVTARTSMPLKRWYREGELVFCAIKPPIVGPSPDVVINVWPGIVEETKLKTMPGPRDDKFLPISSTVNMYKVLLLAVSHSLVVSDDEVLPYQAYSMPEGLIQALSAQELDLNREKMKGFNPRPGDSGPSPNFVDASSPFVVAMHIGVELSKFFSLLDEYEFKYAVSHPPRAHIPPPLSATSLQSAIVAAGRHNAQIGTASTSTIEVDIPRMPEERSSTRFQGLWWGAERIWADDFVRLKVSRIALAPDGTDNIYPPSGPGKKTVQHVMPMEVIHPNMVPGPADVWLANNCIQQEVRVCGMLYELADEDWEESEEHMNPPLSTEPTQSGSSIATTSAPSLGYTPGPSPLKPPSLPNFEPAVPVASTSSSDLPSSPSYSSQPISTSQYLLPEAPRGYRFRQIMPDECEMEMSLSLLSGRYYPRILDHPMLKATVAGARDPSEEAGMGSYLWALEGLNAGFYNAVDAQYYRKSRVRMMDDADKNAMAKLEELNKQSPQRGDSLMEDDTEHHSVLSNSMNVDG
ncbi:hypothetical protein BDQ17DRAFT_1389700 [Cyathus striatus]|nr:hypothetical protein BDQ17DRAFT_1389700 [Cyathus striatus]